MAFPSDLTQLAAWYGAEDSTGNDGDSITSIAQHTAGVGALNESLAAPVWPVLRKAGNGTPNGRNAWEFAAGTQIKKTASGLGGFMNAVPGTTYVVFAKKTGGATTRQLVFTASGSGVASARSYLHLTNIDHLEAGGRRLDADANTPITEVGTRDASWHRYSCTIDYTNALVTEYVDNVSVVGPSAFLTAGSTSATDAKGFGIGCNTNTVSPEGWVGQIACVLAFSRVLNSTELAQMDAYMVATYVTAISNPSGQGATYAKIGRHVTYYKPGTRKPVPAKITGVGSSNGGVILKLRSGATVGDGTTGVLRQSPTAPKGLGVWQIR